METVEINTGERDKESGSGADFIFDWSMKNRNNPPFYKAIMISTYGQQGFSNTTRGMRITK